MRIDNLTQGELDSILRRLTALERATPLANATITRGALTVKSAEGLIVEGSAKVTGTLWVTGSLNGDGTITWDGPWVLNGAGDITGDVDLTGEISVGNMRVGAAAHVGGGIAFTNGTSLGAGASGLEVISGAAQMAISPALAVLQISGSRSVVITSTGTTVNGPFTVTNGNKSFRMDHPTKPGYWLLHGSTESPVSGVEYWGDATLDDVGTAIVELPEYFEALTKLAGRTVLVTPRGFVVDWTDIEDGVFTVTGKPGGRFSWLAKAERHGGDFLLEEEKPD